MAEEIAYGGKAPAGRWGALLQGAADNIPYWIDVSRVTDVTSERDEKTGVVSVVVRAEGGGERAVAGGSVPAGLGFAFTHRLSLSPGSPDILAEIVSLENTGKEPFCAKVLFMRPFAVQARPGEKDSVPNLWKGPVEDWWELEDGSLWGVSSHDPRVLKAVLWYREEDSSQHPDVRCMEGEPFNLKPGAVFRPPSGPIGARIVLRETESRR